MLVISEEWSSDCRRDVPMFARLALPLLGGTPAVWTTCMLFFQAALLAGLLRCGHCGRKLHVAYSGENGSGRKRSSCSSIGTPNIWNSSSVRK